MKKSTGKSTQWFPLGVPLLLGLWSIAHLLWHALDNLPLWADQVFYAEGAVRIVRNYITLPWLDFFRSLDDITLMRRPPGASLLLAPFVYGLDGNIQWIKAASLLWYGAIFAAIHQLGKRSGGRETGLLALAFFVCLPQIYHLEIDPEFYQILLLPLILLCTQHLWDRGAAGYAWWFAVGLLTAIGLMLKWIFALFLLGPCIYLGIELGRKILTHPQWRWRLGVLGKLGLMLLPVLGIWVLWYGPNWNHLTASFSEYAETKEFSPFQSGWTWAAPFYYPTQFVWYNKIVPTLLLLTGIALACLPRWIYVKLPLLAPDRTTRFTWTWCLASLAGFLLYFALRYENLPKKYMFPLLGILAVLAVSWISLCPAGRWKTGITRCLLLYSVFCTLWIPFGRPEINAQFDSPRNFYPDPQKPILWYLLPNAWVPDRAHWPYEAIARSLRQREADKTEPRKLCVLPDLYYFDGFGCRYHLQTLCPTVQVAPLENRKGLENLFLATYLLTSRNSITRYPYDARRTMPEAQTAVALGRWLDRSPAWFNNYTLVDTFLLPRGYGEMQLYQRHAAHTPEAVAALCDFWLTWHLENQDLWPQIQALWRYASREEEATRAGLFLRARDANDASAWAALRERTQVSADLHGYEQIQLGVWARQRGEERLGQALLETCLAGDSYCRWKAALLLGEWAEQRGALAEAEAYYKRMLVLNPERPEPVSALRRLANPQDPTAQAFFAELENEVIHLLHLNRSENANRALTELLLDHGWNQAALPYAYGTYLVGRKEYKNTVVFHRALQANGLSLPDYETILLPAGYLPSTTETPEQEISLHAGASVSFSFLQLEEGTYRMAWEETLHEAPTRLSFRLDATAIGTVQSIGEEPRGGGEIQFHAPAKEDRLTIYCQQGAITLRRLTLQRIRAAIPLWDSEGQATAKSKWVTGIERGPNGGYVFTHEANHALLHFQFHSDPRAWDAIVFHSQGLATQRGTVKLNLRQEGGTRDFTFPFTIPEGESVTRIPIPAEAKQYQFLLGISLKFEDMPAQNERRIANLHLVRQ
ncbi:MAG: glycosyltransferase family 39 protein [bacterium]|jgi:4-amino-4-deoxy-L-arabinose transferase-like glycosyltransferase/tetratricopeptide (TPR) repeat protein|nr:glycosyltransferase family 39 protein [bacterium]